ncbi:MAG: alpha/beta fold hydrolase [Pseudorhodoplanes sp.]|nr:alpha/beta fold hydrolase [Pseudorhodoplanes sp.]
MRVLACMFACAFLTSCAAPVAQYQPRTKVASSGEVISQKPPRKTPVIVTPYGKGWGWTSEDLCFFCASHRPVRPRQPTVAQRQPEILGQQFVLFATNRVLKLNVPFGLNAITSGRGEEIHFGEAIVTIPKTHVTGNVERPGYSYYVIKQSENAGEHFVIRTMGLVSEKEFAARFSGPDSILVFVHGYRVPFEDAIFKAAQIAFDATFTGPVVAYSWPSAGTLAGYIYDNNSARHAASKFRRFLSKVQEYAGEKRIIVVAHSMGSDMVSEALYQASLEREKLNISELVLAAPDIDKDLFTSRVKDIKSVAGKVTIYASNKDRALLASKAGAMASRMGYVDASGPNLVDGIEVIDVSAAGAGMFDLHHGTYSGDRTVLNDLAGSLNQERDQCTCGRRSSGRSRPTRTLNIGCTQNRYLIRCELFWVDDISNQAALRAAIAHCDRPGAGHLDQRGSFCGRRISSSGRQIACWPSNPVRRLEGAAVVSDLFLTHFQFWYISLSIPIRLRGVPRRTERGWGAAPAVTIRNRDPGSPWISLLA